MVMFTCRFLPSPLKRRIKEISRDIRASLSDMIEKREKALKGGEAPKDNLLDTLLESNRKEIEEHGKNKKVGMTIEDVMDECKLFYVAGQETTASLLVWTMIVLSMYPDWQARAREEVLKVYSNRKPDFDGLHHLKIVSFYHGTLFFNTFTYNYMFSIFSQQTTMIFYEVLRLYPPIVVFHRQVHKDVKLGNLSLPAGVKIALPLVMVHNDCKLWGDDAKEFKPERFSAGLLKATNGKASFFPFGGGPRICLGQNFTLLEAKVTLSMILQRFSVELSPTYVHAPCSVISLQPQYGAHVILRKVENKKY
ncbi:unnamed protein product [Sphenostylis stenocarpa]|uniref:Cytochrome P450 n=1 Tax=Sphenostylis stenocarpa TaxID=92480 RepID=A0AA86SGK8_9FABA|nr:unnamed protein product [Sphenostylis stenocarpa]